MRVITYSIFDSDDVEKTLEFAKQEFKFQRQVGNSSLRDQLNSVWRQTGVKPKELDDLIELPKSTKHVWDIFILLDSVRSTDFGNPNPINFTEIQSYSNLSGIEFESWEIELIMALDRLKLNQVRKEMQDQQSKGKK